MRVQGTDFSRDGVELSLTVIKWNAGRLDQVSFLLAMNYI